MRRDNAMEKICVALDVPDSRSAESLVRQLVKHVGFFKVGMELYNAEGPKIIQTLTSIGAKIFLDLKFHDIPNTVAGASKVVAPLGVSIFNVHASGGQEMMLAALKAATDAATRANLARPKIIAITVLTSLEEATLKTINQNNVGVSKQVEHLAKMTKESGLDGVVASPQEIKIIRSACGPNFLIVTPGIRPVGNDAGDQKRIATPAGAVQAGADILVIGRPITAAKDPVVAAENILHEIQNVSD